MTPERSHLPVPLLLRPCQERDLAGLEWFGTQAGFRASFRETFERSRTGAVAMLVADVRGFPAGRLAVDLQLRRREGVALLWSFAVFGPFQGLGIGTRLVGLAERVAVAAGLGQAELAVAKDNPDARRLYERLGYRVVGAELTQYSYADPDGRDVRVIEDCLVLRRRLAAPGAQGAVG